MIPREEIKDGLIYYTLKNAYGNHGPNIILAICKNNEPFVLFPTGIAKVVSIDLWDHKDIFYESQYEEK